MWCRKCSHSPSNTLGWRSQTCRIRQRRPWTSYSHSTASRQLLVFQMIQSYNYKYQRTWSSDLSCILMISKPTYRFPSQQQTSVGSSSIVVFLHPFSVQKFIPSHPNTMSCPTPTSFEVALTQYPPRSTEHFSVESSNLPQKFPSVEISHSKHCFPIATAGDLECNWQGRIRE